MAATQYILTYRRGEDDSPKFQSKHQKGRKARVYHKLIYCDFHAGTTSTRGQRKVPKREKNNNQCAADRGEWADWLETMETLKAADAHWPLY